MDNLRNHTYGHEFASGDMIFRESEAGDCAYIIHSGEVEVFVDRPDGQIHLAKLGAGHIVGEMALIDRGVRTASAVAVTNVVATAITEDHIQTRLRNADPLIDTVLRVILARYRDSLHHVRRGDYANAALRATDAPVTSERGQFDTKLHEQIIEQLRLELDLRQQLDGDGLDIFLQPIISLKEDRVVGYECLSRWIHSELGSIRPDQFVRIAEETGLIHRFGTSLVFEARALQTQLDGLDFAAGYLSINISPRQFDRPEMMVVLGEAAKYLCGQGRQTRLEITESVLMERPEESMKMLVELRDLGYRIALDDFGTGYSSLAYLHRFPIDVLKIDRSFIEGMLEDRSKMVLVRSIISLANAMHVDVIAEGVETEDQAETLRAVGCRYAQGFLYSRAIPSNEAIEIARKMNQAD